MSEKPSGFEPGPGRRRASITVKMKGVVVFHKAGPSNIVLGLYRKFLKTHPEFKLPCLAKERGIKVGENALVKIAKPRGGISGEADFHLLASKTSLLEPRSRAGQSKPSPELERT